MQITKEQFVSTLQMVVAIGRTIEALGEVPAGVLWSQVEGKMTLEDLCRILVKLEDAKLITYSKDHLITWVGPKNVKK